MEREKPLPPDRCAGVAAVSDVRVPIPGRESLSEHDIRGVRWHEAIFVEENYTVEYTKYIHHRRLTGLLSKILEEKHDALIVELGCGNGLDFFAINRCLQKLGVRYVGVDLDRPALERAANRAAYRGCRNIELIWGDVRRTGLLTASADVVLSSEVAEHLTEPRLLFEEIWRVLKPGGTAVVTTPNLSNYPRRVVNLVDRVVKGRLRERIYEGMVERTEGSGFTTQEGILGHVSEKPAKAWGSLAREIGFQVSLQRGDTLVHGNPWLARHPVLFGLLCIVDSILEFFPRWVDTSHDLLMVLRKE